MEPNEIKETKRAVIDTPEVRREVVTERTEVLPMEEPGISTGTIALIAVIALVVVGVIVYLVTNRNENESANRNANIDVAAQANQSPGTTIVQQPAPAQQAPIIIQQPGQQAPVIIQQPAAPAPVESGSSDANLQEAAARILIEDPDMSTISISVSDARAVLTGTANSSAIKAKAERLVRAVRGVRSIDNKILVTG